MKRVYVVIASQPRNFSLEEARELLLQLPAAIAAASDETHIESPQIVNGNLNRDSLVRFFEQHYTSQRVENVVGRLLGRLVADAAGSKGEDAIPFNIVHVRCGHHVSHQSCEGLRFPSAHRYGYTTSNDYLVSVESLKAHAEEFISRHPRSVVTANLSILLDYL